MKVSGDYHEDLATAFGRRFALNQGGGARARFARWRVMHWLIVQRLKQHVWVRAPLFFNRRMWVLTGETISGGILSFGYAESALTALMLEVVRPGMRFIDVGAHLGYEAILACTLVGEAGRVVSFEPQAMVAKYTARNLSNFPQARLVRSAIADCEGEIQFDELPLTRSAFSGAVTGSPVGPTTKVPVTTLDRILRADDRPVDFIKVDVEGGELSVLRGALDILNRDKPFLVLEAEMPAGLAKRPRVAEFEDFLLPLGYRGISFEFDEKLRIAPLGDFIEGHANVAFVHASRPECRLLEGL